MNKISKLVFSISLLFLLVITSNIKSQTLVFKENFDTLSAMISRGWETINKSNPIGTGEWVQGDGMVGEAALSGNATSYAHVDYTSTDKLGTTNNISDWLLTPTILLENNDSVSFYVLSFNSATFPDRLECRLSAMGTSNNVGVNDTTVGDFSTLLLSVNPNLDFVSFPSVTKDSATWTKYTGHVSGLSGVTSCRLGFRYYVTNAGLSGANSSTIGLDSFLIVRFPPDAGVNENELNVGVQLFPNPTKDNMNLSISQNGNYLVNVYSVLGDKVLTFSTQSSRTINVSNLCKGLYSVRVIDIQSGNYKALSFIKE